MKRLFFDVETSPNVVLSWRAGYKINIPHENILKERALICICWKWQDEKRVHSLEWNEGDDKAMVEAFLDVAKDADEIIGHNGDRFDIKWLNTRAVFHRLGPVPKWKTVDTLKMAKGTFLFNSNRLDYLGQHLLGEGKLETGFGLWKDICLKNCPKAMRKMVRYCKRDVDLLQRAWEVIHPYSPVKTRNVHKNKTRATAAGTVQHQMKCMDCGRYYSVNDATYRAYLSEKYEKD